MQSMKLFFLILCSTTLSAYSQTKIRLRSPDGNIEYSFLLKNKVPVYDVSFKGKPLAENAQISLAFLETGLFKHDLKILQPVFRSAVESYDLIVGKAKSVKHPFKEVIIPLAENKTPFRKIRLVVRVFNDGLAFRYEFPIQENRPTFSLTDEHSTFNLVGNPKVLALFLPNYTSSHEGRYSSLLLHEVKEDTLIDMPALFEFPGNFYVAITEAALTNYAGMYLSKRNGVLTSKLSPLPGQPVGAPSEAGSVKVKATLPHHTPWRVMMIGERIGALIESNILTSLNEPNKIKDVSWIKPGKTTFPWWNGSIIPDTSFAPGNNFENNQYYIDFCARNGLEYHTVVESCGHEWYTNDGEGYQPGLNVDVTKPVPGIDMQRICDYAKSKGVGVRVWVHWKALYPKLDTAFSIFEKWGLKGMMVDFMDRDDQEMTNIKEEILIKAAKHKLHIQFHGVEKPTGLSRTYPNEFTREGTLNYEVNKWDTLVTPDHDLDIVFTRMLAGPTDYHLGGFRAVPDSLFKVQYTRPLMFGTRCHLLAMYVVLENYQGMVCDYPAAYEGQPGFDFLKIVPTTWDETKVLNAAVREYITIARKKNNDWFVGAISNRVARTIEVSFSFLPAGEYVATTYTDADQDGDPNKVTVQKITVKNTDVKAFHLNAGGGMVMHLTRK